MHSRLPNTPIYLVGDSFGACLALAVASHHPDVDLVLILCTLSGVLSRHAILCTFSGRNPLLPSLNEGERLHKVLPKCEIRKFNDNGHSLLLEDGIDLAYILKGASYYRRGRNFDYVTDYLPPTPSEFKRAAKSLWEIFRELRSISHYFRELYHLITNQNSVSNELIVGLEGIPSEGPVLFVGYQSLLGFEVGPLVLRILSEKNILVCGIAHPMLFFGEGEGLLPDVSTFDLLRSIGAVPGEEYQLFWPERSEFVRMAARFGAKIVPFGVVGEGDIAKVVVDYNDLQRIPYFKEKMEELTSEAVKLKTDSSGEVANQQAHFPGILPQVPGRLYYLFGKPIETKEREHELKDRQKAQEVYMEVKSEVEKCLAYLLEKRETDPYRTIMSRLLYLSIHGLSSEIPTFEL
ncbi:hypothetical protein RND81_11G188600 [Saponaria officinalis]|uniref:Acyltransferase n=1 Tax=Saponaria officinalis TaxID=3572 RepID=A0AAW1HNS0_SAPOF